MWLSFERNCDCGKISVGPAQKRPFLQFFYVCPEPVLINISVFSMNMVLKSVSRTAELRRVLRIVEEQQVLRPAVANAVPATGKEAILMERLPAGARGFRVEAAVRVEHVAFAEQRAQRAVHGGRAADVLQPRHLRQEVVRGQRVDHACGRIRDLIACIVEPAAAVAMDLLYLRRWEADLIRAEDHPAGADELLDVAVAEQLRRGCESIAGSAVDSAAAGSR